MAFHYPFMIDYKSEFIYWTVHKNKVVTPYITSQFCTSLIRAVVPYYCGLWPNFDITNFWQPQRLCFGQIFFYQLLDIRDVPIVIPGEPKVEKHWDKGGERTINIRFMCQQNNQLFSLVGWGTKMWSGLCQLDVLRSLLTGRQEEVVTRFIWRPSLPLCCVLQLLWEGPPHGISTVTLVWIWKTEKKTTKKQHEQSLTYWFINHFFLAGML